MTYTGFFEWSITFWHILTILWVVTGGFVLVAWFFNLRIIRVIDDGFDDVVKIVCFVLTLFITMSYVGTILFGSDHDLVMSMVVSYTVSGFFGLGLFLTYGVTAIIDFRETHILKRR